jgi:hypothetical protein
LAVFSASESIPALFIYSLLTPRLDVGRKTNSFSLQAKEVNLMAVTPIAVSRDLILVMDNGIGASGQPLTINRTYKYVKSSALDEDIYTVAQALIGLQESENIAVQRRDVFELASE